ncbi:unnamed protein product [Periconia digitata]|uniref:Zinc finger C2H2 LYAR-type domain-containing protein n=1 Tax=Periconia digitata TaxID=1303443 RepID=A0A9W4USS8_9PLEO|nr:unnamed protein product [Periconia digitata]
MNEQLDPLFLQGSLCFLGIRPGRRHLAGYSMAAVRGPSAKCFFAVFDALDVKPHGLTDTSSASFFSYPLPPSFHHAVLIPHRLFSIPKVPTATSYYSTLHRQFRPFVAMVSFSCENCGDVLTKKKLDPHRNQCYGASFTCLDCMVHFDGTAYRAHTSCITEDQKYQGKLYKEKKKPQHQKRDSAQQDNALVPHNAYVEHVHDHDSHAVALVDAPPRAPTPPPAANALGYQERAALPPVNVFDFLDTTETPNRPRPQVHDESRMIEDSQPPAYVQSQPHVDVMNFQVADDDDFAQNGFAYGTESIRPTNERFDSSFDTRQREPNMNFVTPAPKSKHSRTKSRDKDIDTTIRKEERKRKRNSPAELDMTLVHAQQEKDILMSDAPPMLHSGLTGGLNRLLARPEFPPSPEYSGDHMENSPLSPMKRAKGGASKAFIRAQKQFDDQQEKERRAEAKKDKERGRERERKERKVSNALVKIRPKIKKRDDSTRDSRKPREGERRRRRQYSSSLSPSRERKTVRAIEYHPSRSYSPAPDESGQLIVRPNADMARSNTDYKARADMFMSFVNKGPDSERGMSINKTLKRYHRERYDAWDRGVSKADEEKELWKSMRLKRNDRGEIVLFFAPPETAA